MDRCVHWDHIPGVQLSICNAVLDQAISTEARSPETEQNSHYHSGRVEKEIDIIHLQKMFK